MLHPFSPSGGASDLRPLLRRRIKGIRSIRRRSRNPAPSGPRYAFDQLGKDASLDISAPELYTSPGTMSFSPDYIRPPLVTALASLVPVFRPRYDPVSRRFVLAAAPRTFSPRTHGISIIGLQKSVSAAADAIFWEAFGKFDERLLNAYIKNISQILPEFLAKQDIFILNNINQTKSANK